MFLINPLCLLMGNSIPMTPLYSSLRTITEIKQCVHKSTAKLSFVKFWYLSPFHADKTPDIQTHFLRFSFLLLF